jgi:ubiquinone biosynthesis protein
MGRLDRNSRRFLARMLKALLEEDYRGVADIFFRAGYIPPEQSRAGLAQAIRSVAAPILGKPANQISIARLLGQLLQITETFGIPNRPDLLLFQKTILMSEGLAASLDPELNFWRLAEPLIEEWAREALAPDAQMREARAMLDERLEQVPRILDTIDAIGRQLDPHGLKLHPETVAGLRRSESGNRLNWALAIAVAGFVVALVALLA